VSKRGDRAFSWLDDKNAAIPAQDNLSEGDRGIRLDVQL
jgi:hypothetical protein